MSARLSIAIVGGGQLGSRHLQAIAPLIECATVFLVDPSAGSRNQAKVRYEEAAAVHPRAAKLILCADIAEIPRELDLAIVATTANVRLAVIASIARRARVRFWLLEKVMFQRPEEYEQARFILAANSERVWVNLAQRRWPLFEDIRDRFANDRDLRIEVFGSNWGLGSNAVHNADLARFLWAGEIHDVAKIDCVVDSKRAGFVEFTGTMETYVNGRLAIRQESYGTGQVPFMFQIRHPSAFIIWNVGKGEAMECSTTTDWRWCPRKVAAPYQSMLTTDVVQAMFRGADCGLPSFEAAAAVHQSVIGAFDRALVAMGNPAETISIT